MKCMKVKVYLEQVNREGIVIDCTLVAQFRTMGWTELFIENAKEYLGQLDGVSERFKIVEGSDERVKMFITKEDEIG